VNPFSHPALCRLWKISQASDSDAWCSVSQSRLWSSVRTSNVFMVPLGHSTGPDPLTLRRGEPIFFLFLFYFFFIVVVAFFLVGRSPPPCAIKGIFRRSAQMPTRSNSPRAPRRKGRPRGGRGSALPSAWTRRGARSLTTSGRAHADRSGSGSRRDRAASGSRDPLKPRRHWSPERGPGS